MKNRIETIRGILGENEAALIVTPVNRRYLTGFQSSLGYLFCTGDRAVLFVDGRYYLAASGTVTAAEVRLMKKLAEQLCDLVKSEKIKSIFVETELTVSEWQSLAKMLPGCEISIDSKLTDCINKMRAVKTADEIAEIVKAQRIAEKAFCEVLNFIRPGVTERSIANELEYKMKSYGAEDISFSTIAIAGKKTAMPHGVPYKNVIKAGDFVTLDFGAVVNGYHSDMTRTVAVGFATDEMQLVYETVLAANVNVENNLKAGMTGAEGDSLARSVIEAAGYGEYFTHSTGHSVGLEIHETPNLSPRSAEILTVGNIVTDEPGIYLAGKFGVRIEDMLAITESGVENLTLTDKKLLIIGN